MDKKKRAFPHIFAVLFAMMALALIATWLVPSGTYERVVLEGTTRSIVDPQSFQFVDKTYLSPFHLLTAVTDGMTGAALVAFSIIIIGGSWQVIHKTGVLRRGSRWAVERMRERLLIIMATMLMSCNAWLNRE